MTETKYVGIRLPEKIYKNVQGVADRVGIPAAALCRSAVMQMYGTPSPQDEQIPGGVA